MIAICLCIVPLFSSGQNAPPPLREGVGGWVDSCQATSLIRVHPCPSVVALHKEKKTLDNLLGIRIGTSLDETYAILKPLGAGGGKDLRDNGRREAWTLKETDFQTIAFQTTGKGKIKWITGYLRKGQELPMESLGDPKTATRFNDSEAIWNVETKEGGFRLVVKGENGKASVVTLLSTATKDIG